MFTWLWTLCVCSGKAYVFLPSTLLINFYSQVKCLVVLLWMDHWVEYWASKSSKQAKQESSKSSKNTSTSKFDSMTTNQTLIGANNLLSLSSNKSTCLKCAWTVQTTPLKQLVQENWLCVNGSNRTTDRLCINGLCVNGANRTTKQTICLIFTSAIRRLCFVEVRELFRKRKPIDWRPRVIAQTSSVDRQTICLI